MLRQGILIVVILLLCTVQVLAQADCPAIVAAALDAVETACEETGRNQACYGNISLIATAHEDAEAFTFESAGDIADVAAIETLSLSTFNADNSEWGVALMEVQANLPDDTLENVTFLLFGDVNVQNEVETPTTLEMSATGGVNVRLRPRSDQQNVIGSLTSGQAVIATGRLADNSWVRIATDLHKDGVGWVSTQLLTGGDISTLVAVEPAERIFGPMQAFVFESGVGDRPCEEAPDSGILIQTPEGEGTISFLVNEVNIQLGSTVYLQAQANDYLYITVVEGEALVSASGVTQAVPAGTFALVPLDADAIATGAPQFPQPYDFDALQSLPVSVALPQTISVAPALEADEVNEAIQEAQQSVSGEFFPVPGVYNLTWTTPTATVNNQMEIIVLQAGVSFSGRVLGGNPAATIFNRTAPSTYQGAIYNFTFISATEFSGTFSSPDGQGGTIVGEFTG